MTMLIATVIFFMGARYAPELHSTLDDDGWLPRDERDAGRRCWCGWIALAWVWKAAGGVAGLPRVADLLRPEFDVAPRGRAAGYGDGAGAG